MPDSDVMQQLKTRVSENGHNVDERHRLLAIVADPDQGVAALETEYATLFEAVEEARRRLVAEMSGSVQSLKEE